MHITPAKQHQLTQDKIGKYALKVLDHLKQHGYQALMVGGAVRDLLLGEHPKDFDIVTNATPEEIAKIFKNCRLIGKRFRLAHIYYGHHFIEVATFRAHQENPADSHHRVHNPHGMIVRDNQYGSFEEDVWRRDFTINALYYNHADGSVIDATTHGMHDLKHKVIRLIGDPETRYREDPIRIIRAIRFAAKLSFTIEQESLKPIPKLTHLLKQVAPSRLYEEFLKLLLSGNATQSWQLITQQHVLNILMPQLNNIISHQPQDSFHHKIINTALFNTDQRIKSQAKASPAFILAVLLWPIAHEHYQTLCTKPHTKKINALAIWYTAFSLAVKNNTNLLEIPKVAQHHIFDIWLTQLQLTIRTPRKITRLSQSSRYRAGIDFVELLALAGDINAIDKFNWWQKYQSLPAADQKQMQLKLKKR